MSFLHVLSYGGAIVGFLFFILSLACGLYYLAELVEEYTVMTRKIIKHVTVFVVTAHILLWLFDGFPFWRITFSITCHGIYSLNLETFPFINLTSLPFVASCVLVLFDHFQWFQYFTLRHFPFLDIAAFFGICVWLVPFAYFISLSANDHALPSFDPNIQNIDSIPARNKAGILKNFLTMLLQKKDDFIPMISSSSASSSSASLHSRKII
ncbi:8691_t:CDS:2 [Ambispora gerdemannii]|uniref:8691_t:CDS:1 n=1 Tax=Ambispora gerdemannii TaxID=144530 RepID=A0A9N8ZN92_9GLOM|nr:8691_t:CDS:2 [Ambispora gerdemannii]